MNTTDQLTDLRHQLKTVKTERDRLAEALEALADVQPYVYANPSHPHAREWEQRRERALDKAAAALDHRRAREAGE